MVFATSRVGEKEGRCAVKVADVRDFWNGQKEIKVLDPNITACREKRDLMKQYRETGALLDFTQGLDIRLINEDDIADLNAMRLRSVHFAWDRTSDELGDAFARYAAKSTQKPHGRFGEVYILTNYDDCTTAEHVERALHRIYTVSALGFDPYLMIYNKPGADRELVRLQQWCNSVAFHAVKDFRDFNPKMAQRKKTVPENESLFD